MVSEKVPEGLISQNCLVTRNVAVGHPRVRGCGVEENREFPKVDEHRHPRDVRLSILLNYGLLTRAMKLGFN